jgi:DNA-binding transcriptional regulator YiaG
VGLPFCRVTLKAAWQPTTYPKKITHLGDHVRRRRLDLGLTQNEAACQIGVRRETLQHWEFGRHESTVSCLSRVIQFLGYDPRPMPTSLPERLVWYRRGLGLSQAAMAREFGIAPRTLWGWETGRREPQGPYLMMIRAALRACARY